DLPASTHNIGFVGAGSFAQSYLIPAVKEWGASLDGVVTANGMSSKNVLDKFRFNFCSSDINDLLNKEDINTIFIATPHNIHSELVIKSLKANKSVYVEKPLAINEQQLTEVIRAKSESNKPLMVGFNRRFAPISVKLRNELVSAGEPLVVNIRVNA